MRRTPSRLQPTATAPRSARDVRDRGSCRARSSTVQEVHSGATRRWRGPNVPWLCEYVLIPVSNSEPARPCVATSDYAQRMDAGMQGLRASAHSEEVDAAPMRV